MWMYWIRIGRLLVSEFMICNVTICNCDVGIHVRDFEGLWSECNTLKHIRMENVKKGIVFTTTGYYSDLCPGNSAAFTTIEDVDIGLANDIDAVGIQIGGKQIVNNSDPLKNDSDETVSTSFGDCPVFIDVYSSHFRVVVSTTTNTTAAISSFYEKNKPQHYNATYKKQPSKQTPYS